MCIIINSVVKRTEMKCIQIINCVALAENDDRAGHPEGFATLTPVIMISRIHNT